MFAWRGRSQRNLVLRVSEEQSEAQGNATSWSHLQIAIVTEPCVQSHVSWMFFQMGEIQNASFM